jgi:hypothetical protein
MSSLYKTKNRMTSNADHSASISILSAKLTPLALVQLTSESLVNKVMQSVAQGYQFYLVDHLANECHLQQRAGLMLWYATLTHVEQGGITQLAYR